MTRPRAWDGAERGDTPMPLYAKGEMDDHRAIYDIKDKVRVVEIREVSNRKDTY
jgi:mRNA-degrading endonuclease RelE of RelBE toxin-antitoxin system